MTYDMAADKTYWSRGLEFYPTEEYVGARGLLEDRLVYDLYGLLAFESVLDIDILTFFFKD